MFCFKNILNSIFLLWLLINNHNKIFAQTNNFWYQGNRWSYSFDNNGKLIYYSNFNPLFTSDNNSSISNFNGKPILFSDAGFYYNSKVKTISNIKDEGIFWDSKILMMTDTNNYISVSFSNNNGVYGTPKVSYLIRNNKYARGFIVHPSLKEYYPFHFDSVKCISACRNKKSELVFVFRTKKYFYSALLNQGGSFQLLDSFYYPDIKVVNDSLKENKLYLKSPNVLSTMSISNNGEYISFTNTYGDIKKNTSQGHYTYTSINTLNFNKETGEFGTLKLINESFWHYLINKTDPKYNFTRQCFSLNDSFLYYCNIGFDANTGIDIIENLFQYDIFNNTHKIVYTNTLYPGSFYSNSNLSLNHLGEVFFFTLSKPTSTITQYQLNKITKPNLSFPTCNLKLAEEIVPSSFYIAPHNIKHLYDYLRISQNIQYSCAATVNIKNNSQYYIGFANYTWHIQNEQGIEQYYYTKEPPPLTYTKNGDYVIKLFGYSPRGKGYGEWYIDTIKVRIPPKPIANFYAKDSIVCRYTGLQFINHSHAQDTLKNDYLWSFGDGATSAAKNPMHTYTKPGVYTVTLHYKNGYCDSTLTKNQYIKVVDAPKPGFAVLYKQGCAPFIAQFTDTTTLNVQQKDYYFTDTKLWQNVPVSQPTFTHTFAKAGVYKALQRLTGFSGCVIMQDSVIFNISKGLTIYDTTNVINSTVQAKNALVYWGAIDGAVSYQVYKNNSPYKTTADTFFQENIPYTQDVSYTIAGIDSCGNQCSQGRQGKPVFLQATMQGHNEAAVISFSPYLQWQGSNITYAIQKFINGTWQTINSQNANNGYTDNQFLNLGELQACYRIQSQEASQAQILSHSNELCLPYIPTIFIPTAFTPNDDAVNDSFDIVGYGLQSYNISIYNRWGELIFKGKPNEAWGGSNASDGVYTARIEYTTNKGIRLNQRVTVTLMK